MFEVEQWDVSDGLYSVESVAKVLRESGRLTILINRKSDTFMMIVGTGRERDLEQAQIAADALNKAGLGE